MGIKTKIVKELGKKPRRIRELKAKLGNDKKVVRAVEELEKRGKIICRKGVYALRTEKTEGAVECTLAKLSGRFGFARPTDPEIGDIFIPGKYLMGAMPGDVVFVILDEHPRVSGSLEGKVAAIAKENNRFTGTVDVLGGRLVLVPDACPQSPILIKKSADGGAHPGDKAAVEILERGDSHDEHRAGVSMLFGSAENPKSCAKSLLYSAGLERSFPAKVKAEAKKYEGRTIDAQEIRDRRDYRDLCVFTIDSAQTKDIDDAISIEKTETGYRLGVHIADVSHYVRPGTALEAEAFRRGTSVYYADSVVPMLPRQLSNGICSLNEGEDRLAFSCIMELNDAGHVVDYSFAKTVIRSRLKGVYSEINAIFDGTADNAARQRYAGVSESLMLMRKLYHKLAKLRSARGAMEIESGEAKLVLDEDGRCVDVIRRERGEAECMIEEFMLLANTSAAALARQLKLPFVYRVHEAPDPERMETLHRTLTALRVDYRFAGELPTSMELAKLLCDTKGTPIERAVHTNVLRSMAKAKYEPEPKGHFGLALADYAHFTSPIRRYSDLAVHRILSDVCTGEDDAVIRKKYEKYAAEASRQASEREIVTMKTERDIEDCYIADYMSRFIGQELDGVVSSVTQFGVYVELPNTVEGLVRAQALSENPLTLTEDAALYDPQTGRAWRIGDAMRVRVAGVNVGQGNVDFVPADYAAQDQAGR